LIGICQSIPLEDIFIDEAKERINLDLLGPRHSKLCHGASIFVDIDGYTALVDSLKDNLEHLCNAVKLLHLFRYELRHITECDFEGIVVQHQGDRLQALLHLPTGETARIGERAVELCVSYNSSVQELLNREYSALGQYGVAIGCAVGKTLVIRSGVKGDLDVGCIGDATVEAESIQLRIAGGQIGITKGLYGDIGDQSLSRVFCYDTTKAIYLGDRATWNSIEDEEDRRGYTDGSKVGYGSSGSILFGTSSIPGGVRELKVTKPWADEP
jgi:class 3 adenylate cyclase